MQSAQAELEETLRQDDDIMTEQGPNATTNSHELGTINVPKSDDKKDDDYDTRRASEPTSSPGPALTPRSRLRMFAVMAALFVSSPLRDCSSWSQVLT